MNIDHIIKKYQKKDEVEGEESLDLTDAQEELVNHIEEFLGGRGKVDSSLFERVKSMSKDLEEFNFLINGLLIHPTWGPKIRTATEAFAHTYKMSTGEPLKIDEKKLFTLLLTFMYVLQKDKIIKFLW